MKKKIEITTDEPFEMTSAPESSLNDDSVESAPPGNPPDATPSEAPVNDATPATDPKPDTEGASAYIVALQAQLEVERARAEDAEKKLLYLQADFQNYRRRRDEEFKDLQKFVNSELLKALLPILDNFERALNAAEQTQNFDALVAGVAGTLKQLQTFLQNAGVKAIEAQGKEFDPKYHEAIGHTESDQYPANVVAEEVQRGYVMYDRVLRPTLVKVSQG